MREDTTGNTEALSREPRPDPRFREPGRMTGSRVVAAVVVLVGIAAVMWHRTSLALDARRGVVIEVIDGDTIVVALDGGSTETVRLIGVDTPETVHPDRPVECHGPEASSFTRDALENKRVELEFDATRRDVYGRLLAYVHVDGRRFNDEILATGNGRLLVIEPNLRHGRTLLDRELEAERAGRGLWHACH